jgi:Hint domain
MTTKDIAVSYPSGVTLTDGTNNAATIEAGVTIGGDTAFYAGYGLAVENHGAVNGSSYGVSLYGGSLSNAADGTISASFLTAVYGRSGGGPVTVDNSGAITGHNNGVLLQGGGSLTNEATGSIAATNGDGVYVSGDGAVTNLGTISGYDGVALGIAGSLTNAADGTISGTDFGVYVGIPGSNTTIENAGKITGSKDSVYFKDTGVHRLIVDASATFTGNVVANAAGTNTLELSANGGAGELNGLGTKYIGFQTVTIDAGATWTIAGTMAGIHGSTIEGFNPDDRLDLTNLAFNTNDTAVLNGDTLMIEDGAGGVLDTIKLAGDLAHDVFNLADDGTGNHGTVITEDYVPCFCRGTRIRVPHGEAAVEDLRIGDLVTIAGGQALPLKWIGRRGYRDWLAVGNEEVQPIRFKAGSIADHIPARDLYVSPEHAMFLDGVLVPARHLVNGISIVKVAGMEEIDYFHLEFDRHVAIFAEGAAAESFIDDDSRMLFHNAEEYRRLYPNETGGRYTAFCAPRVEGGDELDAMRRRLISRGARLSPGTAVVPAMAHRGSLEIAAHTLVAGWAFAGVEAGPVALSVVVNGAVIGQVVADRYRPDLAAAGIGDGRHAFFFRLPKGLPLDISHTIEVRRAFDWSLLLGAPVTLKPQGARRFAPEREVTVERP